MVTKLFNATLPDVAVFGEKDEQQAAVIKRMVRDLNFPIRIITSPIVREPDGLAMSSRNRYLSDEERQQALAIFSSLRNAKKAITGGLTEADSVITQISTEITAAGGEIDYVEIIDAENLTSVASIDCEVLIAVAEIGRASCRERV